MQKNQFIITPEGRLKAYNGNSKTVMIPEGITEIEDGTFCYSGLETISLPSTLKKIGKEAFLGCSNLKEIKGLSVETLKIGEDAFAGCEKLCGSAPFLAQGKRILLANSKYKGRIILPDGCTIDEYAFDEYEEWNIEISIHCPYWKVSGEAKKYGFAHSIIQRDGATISFRDDAGRIIAKIILAIHDESEPKQNAFILAIHCNEKGEFDFAGYDHMFTEISKPQNKIRMAAVRLQYPYELSDEFNNIYLSYLKRNSAKAGMLALEMKDLDLLGVLCSYGIFNAKAVDQLIDYTAKENMLEATAMLMDYKKQHFKASTVPSLGKLSSKKATETVKASDWRKIYDFKYKNGGVLITGYHGDDSVITFPEKIGQKYVIGIGNKGLFGAFSIDSLNVEKIIIPGWLSVFEPYIFGLFHDNLEIVFQEGIEEICNEWFMPAVYIDCILTVKVPLSVSTFKGEFRPLFEDSRAIGSTKWKLIKGSLAEVYFKEHGYPYTLTDLYTSSEEVKKTEIIRNEIAEAKHAVSTANVVSWKKPKAGTHLVSRYLGNEENVIFPDKVDGVKIKGIANAGGDVPDNYKHIKSVIIPEGYQSIGSKAFSGCENLETIALPSTLREIGSQAFEGCKSLKEFYLPKHVSCIGHNTFDKSEIKTFIIEAPDDKAPAKLLEGVKIHHFVILGGDLKCNGKLFSIVPDSIYTNGSFKVSYLNHIKGWNARKLHKLSEFDDSVIQDAALRQNIADEKSKQSDS